MDRVALQAKSHPSARSRGHLHRLACEGNVVCLHRMLAGGLPGMSDEDLAAYAAGYARAALREDRLARHYEALAAATNRRSAGFRQRLADSYRRTV